MNSEVHPAVVAVVLFLTAVALAIWAWGSGAAASFGGPAELVTGPDGHHFVQIRNYLVEHDTDGSYIANHDLGKLGVEQLLGGLAFYSDGDILLRRGPDPRSLLDKLRAFQRQTNEESLKPETAVSGLFRCDLETRTCQRFGRQGVDFKASYGVTIDRETDDVYITDTSRHLLRKYSADGTELAEAATGFRFPNQPVLHNGMLLVADTNNHVIREIDPESASFGATTASHVVVPAAARSVDRHWPSHFARIGEQWWVNVMKTAMDQGGIYIFDDDWRFVGALELPRDADPIAILPAGNEAWVSDWNNDRVYRFSETGVRLADLESPGLATIRAESRLERKRYQLYSYVGIALVVFILLSLMVRAFAVSMNKKPASRNIAAGVGTDDEEEPLYLEPDRRVLRRTTVAIGATLLLVLAATTLLAYLLASYGKLEMGIPLIGPTAGLIAVVVLMAWVNNANHRTSIRLQGGTLTLRDHRHRESSSPIRDVRYDDASIATRDAVVFLGRPMARIYDKADINERLLPRLHDAKKVHPLKMLQIQVRLRHPQGAVAVIALAGVVIYGALVALR